MTTKAKFVIAPLICMIAVLTAAIAGIFAYYNSLFDLNDALQIAPLFERASVKSNADYDVLCEKDYAVIVWSGICGGEVYETEHIFLKRDKIFHSLYSLATGSGVSGTLNLNDKEDYLTYKMSEKYESGVLTTAIAVTVGEIKTEKENPIEKIVIKRSNLRTKITERIEVDVTDYPFNYLYVDEYPKMAEQSIYDKDYQQYIYSVEGHRQNDD